MEDETAALGVQILGPNTVPLGTLSHDMQPDPGPNHRPGYLVSQTEALEVTFPAETEGVYSVEIYTHKRPSISEERRRSIFFNVRSGLPE